MMIRSRQAPSSSSANGSEGGSTSRARRTFQEPHLEKWWVARSRARAAEVKQRGVRACIPRLPILAAPSPGEWVARGQPRGGATSRGPRASCWGRRGRRDRPRTCLARGPGAEARGGFRLVRVWCRRPKSSGLRVRGAEPRRGAEGGWVMRGGGGRERARSSRARAGAEAALSQAAAAGAASLLPF